MAHPQQLNFLNEFSVRLFEEKKASKIDILEIGSYEVNASIKDLFNGSNYTGIDLIDGPGVDLVMNGEDIYSLNKKFDVIISSECFEHAVNWKKIFKAMINCVKDDGYVVMTCASKGRTEHGTKRADFYDSVAHNYEVTSSPGTDDDYYKNLNKKDFYKNFEISKIFNKHFFFYNIHSFDLYFVGQKKNILESKLIEKLHQKIISNNKKNPSFQSIKRYVLHSLLPEKLCNALHFMNMKRKLKIK